VEQALLIGKVRWAINEGNSNAGVALGGWEVFTFKFSALWDWASFILKTRDKILFLMGGCSKG
jgi:hypothetical protein